MGTRRGSREPRRDPAHLNPASPHGGSKQCEVSHSPAAGGPAAAAEPAGAGACFAVNPSPDPLLETCQKTRRSETATTALAWPSMFAVHTHPPRTRHSLEFGALDPPITHLLSRPKGAFLGKARQEVQDAVPAPCLHSLPIPQGTPMTL